MNITAQKLELEPNSMYKQQHHQKPSLEAKNLQPTPSLQVAINTKNQVYTNKLKSTT